MNKKKFWAIILILFALLLIYSCRGYLLDHMADYLLVEDKLQKADVIIVLGGDGNGERVNQAVRLYKQSYAPCLLMSGGPAMWELTYADWMKKQAISLNVAAKAILLEDKSLSTRENAVFTKRIVDLIKAKKIIVVTSPTHCRRSKATFKKVFGREYKIMVCAAKPSSFIKEKWWTRHEDTGLVVWEYVSLVFYWLKGY